MLKFEAGFVKLLLITQLKTHWQLLFFLGWHFDVSDKNTEIYVVVRCTTTWDSGQL